MKVQDIIDLTKAGFTKDDIMKLTAAEQPAQPAATPAPAQPAPAQPAPAQPAPAQPAPAPAAESPMISKIDEAIGKLVTAASNLQQAAIMNSEQPKQESTDDILSAILNPPQGNK